MHTVPPPAVRTADRQPDITPEFVELLEYWAAVRGLPPDPWPLP